MKLLLAVLATICVSQSAFARNQSALILQRDDIQNRSSEYVDLSTGQAGPYENFKYANPNLRLTIQYHDDPQENYTGFVVRPEMRVNGQNNVADIGYFDSSCTNLELDSVLNKNDLVKSIPLMKQIGIIKHDRRDAYYLPRGERERLALDRCYVVSARHGVAASAVYLFEVTIIGPDNAFVGLRLFEKLNDHDYRR